MVICNMVTPGRRRCSPSQLRIRYYYIRNVYSKCSLDDGRVAPCSCDEEWRAVAGAAGAGIGMGMEILSYIVHSFLIWQYLIHPVHPSVGAAPVGEVDSGGRL